MASGAIGSLDEINNRAPDAPMISPATFSTVNLSFKIRAAKMVINIGVNKVSNDACMEKVKDNPLIKASDLMQLQLLNKAAME